MITVNVELKTGPTTTLRLKVSAPTIERAVEIASSCAGEAGADSSARVLFPIDPETFFAPVGNPTGKPAGGIDYAAMNREEIEGAYEAGLPGAYEAWIDLLKDDLGAEAFEAYARENALV